MGNNECCGDGDDDDEGGSDASGDKDAKGITENLNVADLINVPLARLFQKSLIDGVVPQWLVASVTAIHKKGAKNIPDNYRPVSITSIVGKLMESIVRDNLIALMWKNNLISEKQHGFVPKKNCMTNLLTFLEK